MWLTQLLRPFSNQIKQSEKQINKKAFQQNAYRPLFTVAGLSLTETPLDRDPLDRDLLYRHPLDRDPAGQRPPG